VIDWRDLLTGHIRGIQDAYPQAHEALKDWGLWSSYRFGIYPRMARSVIWNMGKQDHRDYADENDTGALTPEQKAAHAAAQGEGKAEGPARIPFSERVAVEVDIRLHKDDFPAIWRRCLKTAYVHRFPEYQWPSRARCGQTGFLMFFEGGLNRLQRAME
jgi:hypothetical protein